MSEIAEQKALEIYPDIEINWTMTDRTKERMIYADGYDRAIKDFLEKACYYLKSTLQEDDETNDFIIQQFKNYMEGEL